MTETYAESLDLIHIELTFEQLRDLQNMRKDTQKEIADLRQYAKENPEKRLQTATLYVKLIQVVMKLISMEQELLKKLKSEAEVQQPPKQKKPQVSVQNIPASTEPEMKDPVESLQPGSALPQTS